MEDSMKPLNEKPLVIAVDPTMLGEPDNRLDVVFYNPKYQVLDDLIKGIVWQKKELKELCVEPIHRGKTPEYAEEGVPVIKTVNLKNGQIDWNTISFVSETFFEENCHYRTQNQDILIASTGVGSIGKTDIVDDDSRQMVDGHISIVRLDKKIADPYYVVAFLRSRFGQSQIERRIRGTTGQTELYPNDIGSLQVPLPPIQKQHLIGELLRTSLLERRQKKQQSIEMFESTKDPILRKFGISIPKIKNDLTYSAVIDPDVKGRLDPHFYSPEYVIVVNALINGKYPTKSLKELSEPIVSGETPKAKGSAYTTAEEGIPFIRSGDLTDENTIDYSDILYIKKEVHFNKLKRSQLKKGDVLLAIVGTTIGQVSMFCDDREANINQAIARVRVKEKEEINPFYIGFFLRGSLGQVQINRLKRPVARININCAEIGMVKIPVPPIKVQNEIVETLGSILECSREMGNNAELDFKLAKSNIEMLISGRED
jgi:type I restriction enzyme, S subunit